MRLFWKRKPKYKVRQNHGRNVPTHVLNTLARFGISLEEAKVMSDAELLEIPNFGRTMLAFVRDMDPAHLRETYSPTRDGVSTVLAFHSIPAKPRY